MATLQLLHRKALHSSPLLRFFSSSPNVRHLPSETSAIYAPLSKFFQNSSESCSLNAAESPLKQLGEVKERKITRKAESSAPNDGECAEKSSPFLYRDIRKSLKNKLKTEKTDEWRFRSEASGKTPAERISSQESQKTDIISCKGEKSSSSIGDSHVNSLRKKLHEALGFKPEIPSGKTPSEKVLSQEPSKTDNTRKEVENSRPSNGDIGSSAEISPPASSYIDLRISVLKPQTEAAGELRLQTETNTERRIQELQSEVSKLREMLGNQKVEIKLLGYKLEMEFQNQQNQIHLLKEQVATIVKKKERKKKETTIVS